MRFYENNITRREALAALTGAGAFLAGCKQASVDPAPTDDSGGADATDKTVTSTTGVEGAGDASSDAEPSADPEPAADPEPEPDTRTTAEKLLDSMTLEQKVAQLFFVTPEQLTGVDVATMAGTITQNALAQYPVGGLIYFGQNIEGEQQTRDLLAGAVEFSRGSGAGIPVFTGVDEEGGPLVARIANSGYFNVETFPNMAQIGANGDPTRAAYVGTAIGAYLHDIGFSVDFAPDADVLTNPENTVIGPRSFSSDPQVCAEMVAAEVGGFLGEHTVPCAKHFPGHGDTAGDSHTGRAVSYRTADQLHECEYLPFQAAVDAGCPMIMVGHIETPNAAGDGLPATLSHIMITEALRGRLSFNGVVISDSMSMRAVSDFYSPAQTAVMFLQAGGDMILMSPDFVAAYQGVLDAVSSGDLTEERINESVARVIAAKQAAGLVDA